MEMLAQQLRAAGLNELTLIELFGPAWSSEEVSLVLDRYRADDPRAQLVRVFVFGEPVERSLLPVDVDALVKSGLAELDGEQVVARIRLTPYEGLLIPHEGTVADANAVTGVSVASRTLATLTVRHQVERALDVGAGSGVEALLAARHADRVVATDVNPRALELARLAARLNGTELELREGSLFDPVAGERFDLIVANPPFVISPDADFSYRDSSLPGDAICRETVRGAAAHLKPGGFATVLCNWICRTPEERWQPLAGWVDGLDCDALLLSHGAVEPLHYASRWNEPLRADPEAYARTVGRWLDYYEREGVAAIGIGAVVLRGRHGPGWVKGFEAPRPATGSAGAHLVRLFEATGRLAQLREDAELLDVRVALVPGHRLEQALAFAGEYEVASVSMSLADGVGLGAEIEPQVVPLLFALAAGSSTAREAAAAAEIDPAAALPTVRRLLERGLLDLRL